MTKRWYRHCSGAVLSCGPMFEISGAKLHLVFNKCKLKKYVQPTWHTFLTMSTWVGHTYLAMSTFGLDILLQKKTPSRMGRCRQSLYKDIIRTPDV